MEESYCSSSSMQFRLEANEAGELEPYGKQSAHYKTGIHNSKIHNPRIVHDVLE